MKTRKQFLTTVGLGIASVALGSNHLNNFSAIVPALEFAFTATISVGEVQELGITPHGKRRIIPITGGTFEGPVLNGTVEPGGADWQLIRDDYVAELEARYTLKTEDGSFIYVKNRGYRHASAEVLQRLSEGQVVDPKEYYFRTAPVFETASEKYDYFNKYIYVATGERRKDTVTIHFYRVL